LQPPLNSALHKRFAHVAHNRRNTMSKQTPKQPAPTDSKAPTHTLFHIEERGQDKKSFWTEIAVGWVNADGSVNLRSNCGAILLPEHNYQLRARLAKSESSERGE